MIEKHLLRPKTKMPVLDKKRYPKYAGPILVDGSVGGHFHMPERLLQDAVAHFQQADARSLRAAVFSAFASLESFLNQLAFIHSHHEVDRLGQFERDVMEEMKTVLIRGEFVRTRQNYSVDERFDFFFAYFHQQRFDRGGVVGQDFERAKAIRDSWTHPKPPFDVNGPSQSDARLVIEGVSALLRELIIPPFTWMWPFGRP